MTDEELESMYDKDSNESLVDNSMFVQEDVINIKDIEKKAQSIAERIVNKVSKIYYTKDEIKNNGYVQSILERASSTISTQEKMLLCNEYLHDRLLISTCLDSSNTSLYMSLTRIQDTISNIQQNITKAIKELHEDLSMSEDEDDEVDESPTAVRGGKDFIKSLRKDE